MKCECHDILCPAHEGLDCNRPAAVILRRIDQHDQDGTAFCEPCSLDAVESGLYDTGTAMTESEIFRALAVVKSTPTPTRLTIDEALDRALATIKTIISDRRAHGAR